MRKPERVKKMLTPRNPPSNPVAPAWNSRTPATATPRRPSSAGARADPRSSSPHTGARMARDHRPWEAISRNVVADRSAGGLQHADPVGERQTLRRVAHDRGARHRHLRRITSRDRQPESQCDHERPPRPPSHVRERSDRLAEVLVATQAVVERGSVRNEPGCLSGSTGRGDPSDPGRAPGPRWSSTRIRLLAISDTPDQIEGAGNLAAPGGVAEWFRQGPAKPRTRVRFPPPPPSVARLRAREARTTTRRGSLSPGRNPRLAS